MCVCFDFCFLVVVVDNMMALIWSVNRGKLVDDSARITRISYQDISSK